MKFKTKIAAAVASVMVIFGVGAATVTAGAETVEETPIVNTEIGNEIAPETDETITNDTLGEETGNGENTGEITLDLSNLSYEDFLAVVDTLAKETGNEDLWAATLESVKKAVDEKQLTLSTVASFVVSALLVVKIVSDWILKKKEKQHIAQAHTDSETLKTQSRALNSIMDEEEKISSGMAESLAREKRLAAAGAEQNAALRCLVRGVQLHDTARDEALRHLNNSDKLYDKAKQ